MKAKDYAKAHPANTGTQNDRTNDILAAVENILLDIGGTIQARNATKPRSIWGCYLEGTRKLHAYLTMVKAPAHFKRIDHLFSLLWGSFGSRVHASFQVCKTADNINLIIQDNINKFMAMRSGTVSK